MHIRDAVDDLPSQIFALIPQRPLTALNALRDLRVEDPAAVTHARRNGEAWQQIADQLRVSRVPLRLISACDSCPP
ncbi:hypothetical protein JBE04_05625 [Streptomyces sp. PRKS01-29]|nr:hypothetical protein [Streptomyces sabulosicollis]MBI0293982.1 hypothetical protein [Streptomyces sabulosicollis]